MTLNGLILTMVNDQKFQFDKNSMQGVLKAINDDGTFKYNALNISNNNQMTRVIYTKHVVDVEYIWINE